MGRGRARQTAAPLPAPIARAALTPLRAFPAGARHVFKQLLLDRQPRRAPTSRVGAGSRVGSGRLLLRRPCIRELLSQLFIDALPNRVALEEFILRDYVAVRREQMRSRDRTR